MSETPKSPTIEWQEMIIEGQKIVREINQIAQPLYPEILQRLAYIKARIDTYRQQHRRDPLFPNSITLDTFSELGSYKVTYTYVNGEYIKQAS